MKEKLKTLIIIGLLVTNLIVLGVLLYRKPVQVEIPKIVTITDTITIEQIKEKTKLVYVEHYDTIVVYNTDTLTITLPIEHNRYVDTFKTDTSSLSLRVDYSGFKSKIDTIMYDFNYQPQPQPVKKKRVGQSINVGLQVGYGIMVNKQPQFQPYIGIGISYGIGFPL